MKLKIVKLKFSFATINSEIKYPNLFKYRNLYCLYDAIKHLNQYFSTKQPHSMRALID